MVLISKQTEAATMRWETAIDVLLIHGRVKDPPRGLGHSESGRSRRCKETEGEERAVCCRAYAGPTKSGSRTLQGLIV